MTHTFVQPDYANATFQTLAVNERETAAPIFVNQQCMAQKCSRYKQGTMGTEGGRPRCHFFFFSQPKHVAQRDGAVAACTCGVRRNILTFRVLRFGFGHGQTAQREIENVLCL